MTKSEKLAVKEVMEIIERLAQLSAHENVGAIRHDLIEAHRILGDTLSK